MFHTRVLYLHSDVLPSLSEMNEQEATKKLNDEQKLSTPD